MMTVIVLMLMLLGAPACWHQGHIHATAAQSGHAWFPLRHLTQCVASTCMKAPDECEVMGNDRPTKNTPNKSGTLMMLQVAAAESATAGVSQLI